MPVLFDASTAAIGAWQSFAIFRLDSCQFATKEWLLCLPKMEQNLAYKKMIQEIENFKINIKKGFGYVFQIQDCSVFNVFPR